ncbi:J domain-containing protein [Candidatus Woesearchaeota archaeon]|jgi:hypothetical protein|nr:J domain-containing protein [Candidatus Woesearchaeota archaeon]
MDRNKALTLLGLDNNFTIEEIKKSYRSLAIECHPDHNPNNPDAKTEFGFLADAYRTLMSSQGEVVNELPDLKSSSIIKSRFAAKATELARKKRDAELERQKQYHLSRKESNQKAKDKPNNSSSQSTHSKHFDALIFFDRFSEKPLYQRIEPTVYHATVLIKDKIAKDESLEKTILSSLGSRGDDLIGEKVEDIESKNDRQLVAALIYAKQVFYDNTIDDGNSNLVFEMTHFLANDKKSSLDTMILTAAVSKVVLSSGGYSIPYRMSSISVKDILTNNFKSLYQALLPYCENLISLEDYLNEKNLDFNLDNIVQENDFSPIKNIVKAAELYVARVPLKSKLEELQKLLTVALDGKKPEIVASYLTKSITSLTGIYSKRVLPERKIFQQYQNYLDSIEEIKNEHNLNDQEMLDYLSVPEAISGFRFRYKMSSLNSLADFMGDLVTTIPKEKAYAASRLVEALSVASTYCDKGNTRKAKIPWLNVFREVLPVYAEYNEKEKALFNSAMVALSKLERSISKDKIPLSANINLIVETAAYQGINIVDKALKCGDPEMMVDQLGNFLNDYWHSEFRTKNPLLQINSRQKEAYSTLREMQNKASSSLRIDPQQLGEIVDIYFKE